MQTERPVRRDARSGQFMHYHAFEGWRPSETAAPWSSWLLVAIGAGLVALALHYL